MYQNLNKLVVVLKNAFGVQRMVPVVEQPKGTTILSLNFSPSPSPSVTENITQQTTLEEKPELDFKQKQKMKILVKTLKN